MKILIADSYYPEFLKSLSFDAQSSYEVELQAVLSRSFGTADFYSRNLRALGWDAVDVIANHRPLQDRWAYHYGISGDILQAQIRFYDPDVIFIQDLSLATFTSPPRIMAAQLSCPWPGDDKVKRCDVAFSSFPHYIPRIEALGVKAVYLPLAFEPAVLEGPGPERDLDITFVGGVSGAASHWKQGTDTLETVAAAFKERFHWFGYGLDRLPASSALRACYRGEAWGKAMYDVYRRSKIVLNRHGEVAEGYANNLRLFEASGAGALLATEAALNLSDFFAGDEAISYTNAVDAVAKIRWFLDHSGARKLVASNGQRRTLRDHTYAQRMKVVSEVLTEMLCPA